MHWVGSMKRMKMTEEERRVAHCRSQAAYKARGILVGGQSSARGLPKAPPSFTWMPLPTHPTWMPLPTQPWASSSSSSAACDSSAAFDDDVLAAAAPGPLSP